MGNSISKSQDSPSSVGKNKNNYVKVRIQFDSESDSSADALEYTLHAPATIRDLLNLVNKYRIQPVRHLYSLQSSEALKESESVMNNLDLYTFPQRMV